MRKASTILLTAFLFCVMAGLALLTFSPGVALAQAAADSLSAVVPSAGPISGLGTALIGVGASLLTGVVTGLSAKADKGLGNFDATIRSKIGPVLPAVTVGFSVALPLLTNALHLTQVPDAATIVNAPASAIVGIAVREAWRKWLSPLVKGAA